MALIRPGSSGDHLEAGRSSYNRPMGGLFAAGVLLAGLSAVLLWLSMLMGPWRLAGGLLDGKDHLEAAQHALRHGAIKTARYETLAAVAAARRARAGLASGGPLLAAARLVPGVDDTITQMPHIVDAAGYTADAVQTGLHVIQNALKGRGKVISHEKGGARIRLGRLDDISRSVDVIAADIDKARRALLTVDINRLPHAAHRPLVAALRRARDAERGIGIAQEALGILPGVLGAEGKRTYLIGAQNSDELRGTGGALLQYTILTVDDGAPDIPKAAAKTVYAVDKNRSQFSIPLPADAFYVASIPDAQRFGNANWSPDWPLSARLTLQYGRAASPDFPDVDGFIAVDPIALEQLMPGAGRFRSPKAHAYVTAGDIVSYILYRAYGKFPKPQVRRAVLKDIVAGFYDNVLDPAHPSALPAGMAEALSQKHIQVWMKDPREQAFFERLGWAGALWDEKHPHVAGEKVRGPADYLNVVEQNVGGNKFNYFEEITRNVRVDLGDGDARVTTQVQVHNGVFLPQPRWILGDQKKHPVHKAMLNVYVPSRAKLVADPRISPDGARLDFPEPAVWQSETTPAEHYESDKKVWSVTLQLTPGQTGTVEYRYDVPGVIRSKGGRNLYRLVLQHQPKVRSEHVHLVIRLPEGARDVEAKGFVRRSGELVYKRPLVEDTVLEVSWRS